MSEIRNTQTSMRCTDEEYKRRMRRSDYVCFECGRPYLTESQIQEERCCTFHVSECGLCGEETGVTHIRNYNWLRKSTINGHTEQQCRDFPTEENKENQENDVNNTLQVETKDDTKTIS